MIFGFHLGRRWLRLEVRRVGTFRAPPSWLALAIWHDLTGASQLGLSWERA